MELNLPILETLAECRSILVMGMGGGFDVYCGVPIYLELRRRGMNVHLGSLSFSPHLTHLRNGVPLTGTLTGVTADHEGVVVYFPELHLVRWLRTERGDEATLWCFRKTGVDPMIGDFRRLVDHLSLDALLLVDGGVDSLSRGDEAHMGSVLEDWVTLAAAAELDTLPVRMMTCLGLGAEEEVSHAHIFENIARLTAARGFLGSCSLVAQSEAGRAYDALVTYAQSQPYQDPSIINSSILSAVRGEYGDYHLTQKTRGRTNWISPLMSIYWFFDLVRVAEQNLVLSQLRWSQTPQEAGRIIAEARVRLPQRPLQKIPLP